MISEKEDKMTDFLVGASVAYGRSNSQEMHVKIGEAVTQLHTYIAELEAEKDILEDQLREAKNHLIDKNLHIDSLYEDGFKLQKRIAELEEAQRWNPVSERLPEKKGYYMTAVIDGFDGSRSVEKFRYFGDGEFFAWSERYTVTHWMPLPKLPEVQQ